ncbi:MAG: ATP-binding protein [Sphingobacteriales bacterium]|nr:ATP-binding protein [Sphingobacteriales bacterium]
MEIVLTNLLSNAIKFVDNNGEIIMNISDIDESEIKLTVYDDGPGVPKKEEENLFLEFYQASPRQQKQKGTGIGLALSKKLIELHQGKIEYKRKEKNSIKKDYTCFEVTLKKGTNKS